MSDIHKALLEGAADAVIATDVHGRIVLWNPAAETLFGYSRDHMLGTPVSLLLPDRHVREYEKGVAAAFQAGKAALSHITTIAKGSDGVEFPAEAAVSILGSGGDAIAVGFVRKISERFRKQAVLRDNERRLREAEQLAGMGSFEWAVGSNEVTWSDQLARIYGYEPGQHPRTLEAFMDRVHSDDRSAVRTNIARALSEGSAWAMEERIIRADSGETRVLASQVKAIRDARGQVVRLCGICHDVTEQRRAEDALSAAEARFRRGFDDAPIGMLLVVLAADDATITRTNKALSHLLDYSKTELAHMHLSEIVDRADWVLLHAMLQRALNGSSTPAHVEIRLRGRNEASVIALAAASRIGDETSGTTLIVHVEDITVRKQVEEQLRQRALHDPLTSLPNRDLLLDRLSGALARAVREGRCVGLLFLDLDNFQIVNDTMGHATGDEILRTAASRLASAVRGADAAARVGGDEFVMVHEGIENSDQLVALAERIAAILCAPVIIGAQEFITTVSIGIALGQGKELPEELLRDAELALHRAKQRGTNTVQVFNETLRRHAFDRVEVERDLRRALAEGEIEPYYQPIVNLATGRIGGFEALARWHHPERGLLLPKYFLPVAEATSLIGPLGAMMLRSACRQLAIWQRTHPYLTMAVNLSLRQLDSEFVNAVADVLQEYSIPPHSLHVEVTESVLLDIEKSTASHLKALAGLGVQLGIDDFGTGYSSLLYLKQFPVRFLKIDKSFVDGLPDNQEDAIIVSAIVQLGHSLDLSTIAEGVETAEQYDALREIGSTSAQGYYMSKPKSADECVLILDENVPVS